jgi:hypothetical protein
MVHPMGLSLETELEYRRSRLVQTSRTLPRSDRANRANRAGRRAARAARVARPAVTPPRAA